MAVRTRGFAIPPGKFNIELLERRLLFVGGPDGFDFTAGLVAHYKLDEGNGLTAGDSSGQNNPATLNGGAIWTSGHVGGAIALDGSTGYLRASHAVSLGPNRLTLATWANSAWVALPCRVSSTSVECTVRHLSLFALIVSPAPSTELDAAIPNGWFYKQANGYSGAGDLGYAVVDDEAAAFWYLQSLPTGITREDVRVALPKHLRRHRPGHRGL